MSKYKFNYFGYDINYEVYGKGKPILILNGIMMSTKSWHEFLDVLTKNNQIILLDFIDQGDSSLYKDIGSYNHSFQTEIIKFLLKELNLEKISIASISYGGIIALDFASKYPDLVEELVLFNTSAYTSEWMKEIYKTWNEAALIRNGSIFYKATIPTIYSESFYRKNLEWMKEREKILIPLFNEEVFLDKMIRLVNSIMNVDILEDTKNIKAETLIVSSREDFLTPQRMQYELNENISNSSLVLLPNTGHATMYENRVMFLTLILGFVNR